MGNHERGGFHFREGNTVQAQHGTLGEAAYSEGRATSYQPSRTELREDVRVKATFEQAIKALGKPVRIHYMKSLEELG